MEEKNLKGKKGKKEKKEEKKGGKKMVIIVSELNQKIQIFRRER